MRIFSILACLALSLAVRAEAQDPAAKELLELNGTSAKASPLPEPSELLDYHSLMKELGRILADQNQLRARQELDALEKQVAEKYFLVRAFVEIKSNPLIAKGKRILWLEKDHGLDVGISFRAADYGAFESVQEYDFITAVARLEKLQDQVIFDFLSLKSVDVFDPRTETGEFVRFNDALARIDAMKADRNPQPDMRKSVESMSRSYRNRLGYLIGTVDRLDEDDGRLFLLLKVGGQTAKVECLSKFRKSLATVEAGNKVAIAARLSKLSFYGTHDFFRGCMIEMPDAQ